MKRKNCRVSPRPLGSDSRIDLPRRSWPSQNGIMPLPQERTLHVDMRRFVVRPALGEAALEQAERGPALERFRVSGTQRNGAVVVGPGLVELAEVLADHAAVVEGLGIVGPQVRSARSKDASASLDAPQVVQGIATVVPGFGEFRLRRYRVIVAGQASSRRCNPCRAMPWLLSALA